MGRSMKCSAAWQSGVRIGMFSFTELCGRHVVEAAGANWLNRTIVVPICFNPVVGYSCALRKEKFRQWKCFQLITWISVGDLAVPCERSVIDCDDCRIEDP